MSEKVDFEGLEALAKGFVGATQPNNETATVFGLKGDLGSGKTTFTKFVAEFLGVKEVVTSPTFVIEKIYDLTNQDFDKLIHIDAYRLESAKELMSLNWGDILKDPKNLIIVEWPEKISEIMPSDTREIQFKFIDEDIREVDFK